ncbi:hypothetical protein LCGC14_1535880 [marine sediment metagenome]|uniref:Uncharacterized protein n=1 Tax=marine sediment metagenome TaxID=412755 RepID=A0A0F9LVC3_9ZZZZ
MLETETRICVDYENTYCQKCNLLIELFERTPKSNRDYWIMTELFVFLHDGLDVCNERTKMGE